MRRIKRAKITFVSLCPRGKNQLPVIFKEDGAFEIQTLVKGDTEGELTALVYVPERADSDGDEASAQVIKEMAHDYLRDGGKIDLRHDGQALSKDKAYVAQSFIVQKGDPRFEGMVDYNGNLVDATGGWGMVVKIEDPELQRLYKEGKWNGVSMFGTAEFEQQKEEDEGLLRKLLSLFKSGSANQEDGMNKDFEALKKSVDDLALVVKGIVDQKQAEAKLAKEKEAELAKEKEAKLAKEKEAELAKEKGVELAKALTELAKAKAEVEKLQKASNQSTEDSKKKDGDDADLLKKEQELFKMGRSWGENINKELGL